MRRPAFCLCLMLFAPRTLPGQAAAVSLLDAATLRAPRLGESSGVAASRRRPGVFWTMNDSGDGPFLYATDSAGSDLGAVRVRNATNVDWEDLATGPCPDGSSCLYIGDIGDNNARRSHVVVYRLAEPDPPTGSADDRRTVPTLDSLILRYPDRPHDAEALAVTHDGWLLVVTKDLSGPPRLFRAALGANTPEQTFEPLGELPIVTSVPRGRLVTGADVSPDGRWLVVRTYVSLHIFRLEAGGRVTAVTGNFGLVIPIVETQGEAVAFDGPDRLVLTSERGRNDRPTLARLRLTLPNQQ